MFVTQLFPKGSEGAYGKGSVDNGVTQVKIKEGRLGDGAGVWVGRETITLEIRGISVQT